MLDYWKECISIALDEIDVILSNDQVEYLARAAESGHEHYGMAFYSPPASERLDEIEEEYARKLKALQKEFDNYKYDAETAVKRALRQHYDANVSIGKHGEVLRHDGRITQIQ